MLMLVSVLTVFLFLSGICQIVFSWLISWLMFTVFADKRLQVCDGAEKPVAGCLLALFSSQMDAVPLLRLQ